MANYVYGSLVCVCVLLIKRTTGEKTEKEEHAQNNSPD